MYIYLFFIYILGFLPLIYIIDKRDISSPLFLIWGSSIFSVICAIYKNMTNGFTINFNTCILVMTGYLALILGDICASFFLKRTHKINCFSSEEKKESLFNISLYKMQILCISYIFFSFFLIATIFKITGTRDIQYIPKIFRVGYISGEQRLPFVTQQLYRMFRIISTYLTLYFVSIIVSGRKKKVLIYPIFCIVLFCFWNFLMGSRSDILYLFFAGLIFCVIAIQEKNVVLRLSLKTVTRVIIITTMIFLIFGLTRIYFGRDENSTWIDYLSMYGGSSIYSFDYYINHPYTVNRVSETFGSLMSNLSNYISNDISKLVIPHVWIHGIYNGNTYTALKKYYADGGILGIICFSSLFSIIFTALYRNIVSFKKKSMFLICLYGYFSPALFLFLYDEQFFSKKICFGLVIDVVTLILVDSWVSRVHIDKGKIFICQREKRSLT